MDQLYNGIQASEVADESNLQLEFRDTPYWNERVTTA